MDIERVFLSCFKIKEKPHDIFSLIEAALQVGASKYPAIFEKRKNRILKFIMDPTMSDNDWLNLGVDDDEEEEEDTDEQVTDDKVTDLVQHHKQFVGEKEAIQQSHNTVVGSRKRTPLINESTKRVQVSPPHEKQPGSDCTFKKGEKQLQKESHKGNFKKMETDQVQHKKVAGKKKGGDQQIPALRRNDITESAIKQCKGGLTKSMSPLTTKMSVATKGVVLALPCQKLISDYSPQKQRNCSATTRPKQKIIQTSAVARPMQKETESISDMKKKFETSKRKFEERAAEQREAKRRAITEGFHHMPKLTNDPNCALKRYWDRRRF